MAIKYNLEFLDDKSNEWKVTFDFDGYTGDSTDIIAVDRNPLIIRRESDADDIMSPIVYSSALISVYNEGQFDIEQLSGVKDKECSVTVLKNSNIKFSGYLTGDGIEESLIDSKPMLVLTAIDGLKLLDDMDFDVEMTQSTSVPTTPFNIRRYSPIHILSTILYHSDGLDSKLPLFWFSSVKSKLHDEDTLTSSILGSDRALFIDGAGNKQSCGMLLKGIVESISARIYQEDGRWFMDRIEDAAEQENINYKYIDMSLGEAGLSNEAKKSHLSDSGDFRWIEEDAVSFISPALKSMSITYNPVRFKNIIPNGSMDRYTILDPDNPSDITPLYWRVTTPVGSVSYAPAPSIVNDSGRSLRASFGSQGDSWGRVYMWNNVNINNNSGANIFIDSRSSYVDMEFGFTYVIDRAPTKTIDDVEYIDDSAEITVGILNPVTVPSYPLRFKVSFNIGGFLYYLTKFGHWTNEANDEEEWLFGISANTDNNLIKLGDVVSTNMNKHTLKLPDISKEDFDNSLGLRIEFLCSSDIRVYIDDVYVNVYGENETYRAAVTNPKSSFEEDKEIRVSSSPNGFYLSNYMESWDKSISDYLHSANGYEGTLTDISARSHVRVMGNDSRIVDTSVYSGAYSFGNRWNVDVFNERIFMETRSEYNCQTCTSKVTLHEVSLVDSQDIISEMLSKSKGKADSDRWM